MATCLYESTLQKVELECECTPVQFIDIVDGFNACEGAGKNCMKRLTDEMGSSRLIEDNSETKECLANCKDQQHSFLLSQAVFPNTFSFHKLHEFCIVFDKMIRSCDGDRRDSLAESQPKLCPLMEEALDNNHTCEDLQASIFFKR